MDYIDIKRESNDIKILIKVIFSEKYFINLVHVFGPAFLHYSIDVKLGPSSLFGCKKMCCVNFCMIGGPHNYFWEQLWAIFIESYHPTVEIHRNEFGSELNESSSPKNCDQTLTRMA